MDRRATWKLAYAAAVLVIAAFGLKEFRGTSASSHSRQQEIQDLTSENTKLREEIELKQQRVDKLTNDPAAQELEIRKRLKLVKPNETMYLLPDGDDKSSKRAAPSR
jgi:cell division protein FtsB